MNQVTIMGRIGRIERKGQVLKLSVATDRVSKGEKATDWHPCVAFGQTADSIEKFFTKGKPIAIAGWIQRDSYEKDGVTRYTADVMVGRWYFVPSTPAEQADTGRVPAPKADTFDEIPF